MIWHSWPTPLSQDGLVRFQRSIQQLNERGGYRKPQGRAEEVTYLVEAFYRDSDLLNGFVTFPTRSGFDALQLAIALLVRDGPVSIVVPAFAYHAAALAAARSGAEVLWCDVDQESWNASAASAQAALHRAKHDARILMPVDNFGTPVDLAEMRSVADIAGAHVLLDACESIGASRNGWSLADAIATSFSFSKPVHAAGMGGALTIRLEAVGAITPACRALAGQIRLPELNAAFLLEGWSALASTVEHLRALYEIYSAAFLPLGWTPQKEVGGLSTRLHAPFLLRPEERTLRDYYIERLRAENVEARPQFPVQPLVLDLPYGNVDLDQSVRLADTVISLPSGGGLSVNHAEEVIGAVMSIVGQP